MTEKLHIIHAPQDGDLVGHVVDFLEAAFPSCQLTCSKFAGYKGDPDTAVMDADAVVAVLSHGALLAATVPFELGVARCLGKPAIIVVDESVEPTRLALPLSSEHVALAETHGSMLAVGRRLAATLGVPFGLGHTMEADFTPAPAYDRPTSPNIALAQLVGERRLRRISSTANDSTLPGIPLPELDFDRSDEQPTPTFPTSAAADVAAQASSDPGGTTAVVPTSGRDADAVERADHDGPVDTPDAAGGRPVPANWDLTNGTVPSLPEEPASDAAADLSTQGSEAAEGFVSAVQPTCYASLEAGRAIARCAFERKDGASAALELGESFGAFMEALGNPWSALRDLESVSAWMNAADHALDNLPPGRAALRRWYELGAQLSTLLHLAGLDPDDKTGSDLDEMWSDSMATFIRSAEALQWGPASAAIVEGMLENLRGPVASRDHESIDRIQSAVRDHAIQADTR